MKTAIFTADKIEREEKMNAVEADIYEHFADIYPDNADDVADITQKMIKEIVRHMIAVDKIRPDGRRVDEVRPALLPVRELRGEPRAQHGQSLQLPGCGQLSARRRRQHA